MTRAHPHEQALAPTGAPGRLSRRSDRTLRQAQDRPCEAVPRSRLTQSRADRSQADRSQALSAHTRLRFLPLSASARPHELATQRGIAQRLAVLLGCAFEGDQDPAAPAGEAAYLVPNETLTSLDAARRHGIHGEGDLFGGVVPAPFVATKTITHPLVGHGAVAPDGWQPAFGERVEPAVLPGWSAFSAEDARAAARRLLPGGPVRVKLAEGIGGSGQWVVRDEAELDAGLARLDAGGLAARGVVLERNVLDPRTFSIGLLHAGSLCASYFGTQRTTLNRHGQEVYGGSSITVVRGGFDALEQRIGDDADVRRALALARIYHSAALACFAGMFASRCNYDVIQGRDAGGRPLAGVLEQSWRLGGASGAELLALQALRDDPALDTVRACTVEAHGALRAPPAGATVFYAGVDPHVGPITKYALIEDHADPRTAD